MIICNFYGGNQMNVFSRMWMERKANVPAFSSYMPIIDNEEENMQETTEVAISNDSQNNEFWDDVTEENLPSKIEAQYQNILEIDKAIQEAQKNAEKALATAREQIRLRKLLKSWQQHKFHLLNHRNCFLKISKN